MATHIRKIAKTKEGLLFLKSVLPHKRAMLYFDQPSTRTFLSFYSACQILGMNIAEVRDINTSSELKGESPEDSIRTLSSYFDLIIIRSKDKDFPKRMANLFLNIERTIPIINAGSGSAEHPTQALLDIYTLLRSFENTGGITGKNIMFVGDLKRSRTVKSLSKLLTLYYDVHQTFVAPKQLQATDEILQFSDKISYTLSEDFESQLKKADAIYMTRIQSEWDTNGESSKIDISKFCLNKHHLNLLKKDAVVMHPLPRRNEIGTEIDRDPRAMYWRQVRNGMWIRVALIAILFSVDVKILKYTYNNS